MTLEPGLILLVPVELLLTRIDMVEGDPVHLELVESLLELTLLGHLLAEA